MRVKCPQCGKEFAIPETEVHRLLKCVCKNLFRAADAKAEAALEVGKAEIKLESKAGFYMEDENTEEPDSSISGAELDGYLNNLKKNRTEIRSQEEDSLPKTVSAAPKLEAIEVGESRAEKKPDTKKKSLDEISQALGISDESSIPSLNTNPEHSFAQNPSGASRVKSPPMKERSALDLDYIWDRFQNLSLPVQAAIGAAFALPICIGVYFMMRTPEKPPEQMDPRLVKLLSPKVEEPQTAKPVEVAKVAAEPVAPKLQARPEPVVKKKFEIPKPASAEFENKRYFELRKNSYAGDFENVIRIGSAARKQLNSEELALFFEAQLARATRNRERLLQVLEDIRGARRTNPDSTALMRAMSAAELRVFKDGPEFRRPLETLKSLSLTRPRDPLVNAYLGMVYEKLERLDLAQAAWEQALSMEPYLVWLIERRLQIYRVTQDFKKAQAMAMRLTSIPESESKGFRELASISAALGDNPQAQKYLRQALRYRDDPEVRIELAETSPTAMAAVNELNAGLKAAKSARTKAVIYSRLGRIYCAAKQIDAGLRYLREASKEDPNVAEAHFERGVCERTNNQLAKSLNAFEAALKLDPDNAGIWYEYAISLKMDQKFNPALSALQHSLDLQATDTAHLLMAELLRKLGKNQEALINAKKAAKINPKNKRAQTMLSELTQ